MINLFKKSFQVRRWIKYVVIPSFIPIILIVIYDIILGCTIENIVNKHLVDFILIVFAITISVYGSAKELDRKTASATDQEKSDNYVLWSMVVGVWCTAFFTFLYDKLKPEDDLSFKKVLFCFIQAIVTYFIIYKGMQTEHALEELLQQRDSDTNHNSYLQEVNPSDV